jgi:hypothetical protein
VSTTFKQYLSISNYTVVTNWLDTLSNIVLFLIKQQKSKKEGGYPINDVHRTFVNAIGQPDARSGEKKRKRMGALRLWHNLQLLKLRSLFNKKKKQDYYGLVLSDRFREI